MIGHGRHIAVLGHGTAVTICVHLPEWLCGRLTGQLCVQRSVHAAGHRLAGHLTRRIRDGSDAMLCLIDRSADRASHSDLLSIVHYVLIIELLLLAQLLLIKLLIELLLLLKSNVRRAVSIVFIIHFDSHTARLPASLRSRSTALPSCANRSMKN